MISENSITIDSTANSLQKWTLKIGEKWKPPQGNIIIILPEYIHYN